MTTTIELIQLARENHKKFKKLVELINQTGGTILDPENPGSNLRVPAADPQWLDLAILTEDALTQCREIETLLNSAGHPLPDEEKCPEILEN